MKLFDTAGMRKRARIEEKLEKLSVADALRAIRFAEVVVVLLDSTIPFEKQDLTLVDLTEREGRTVVIGLNKWDLVADKAGLLAELKEKANHLLAQVRGVPIVPLSGLAGEGIDRLMQAVFCELRGLEPPRLDGADQPLARRRALGPSAAGRGRAAHQDPLHDAGQGAPADLRAVRQPARPSARAPTPTAARSLRPFTLAAESLYVRGLPKPQNPGSVDLRRRKMQLIFNSIIIANKNGL